MAATIDIDDGEPTPVTRTFELARMTADFSQWLNRAPDHIVGFDKLSFEVRRPAGPSADGQRNFKLLMKLDTPLLETTSTGEVNAAGYTPAPTVAYRPVVEVRMTLPERASEQDIDNLFTLLKNSMAGGKVSSFFSNNMELPGL